MIVAFRFHVAVSLRDRGISRLGETRWLWFASWRDAVAVFRVSARRGYYGLRLGETRLLWFASWRGAVAVVRVSARRGGCVSRLGETRLLWFASWRGAVAVVCVLARRGGCGLRLGETRWLWFASRRDAATGTIHGRSANDDKKKPHGSLWASVRFASVCRTFLA
ncbi:hypothetical protein Q31b_31150 [Novipirellula aureliae]|uniref:Uncharacterized protein n=1 Tax=Novipirellula aureliae TaxID=2527966 RepID=A0A5C6E1W5_9BACT|nr:hypothetical protein Q31b_31150 [Novipirellula aureliae]